MQGLISNGQTKLISILVVPQDEAISNSVNVNWLITSEIVSKFDQVC